MDMIQRKAFKKWFFISLLCGAHSFFWGLTANGNPIAMLLGILTLAMMFSVIESNPKYQAKRAAAPRLSRALDGGVKFRCWLAVYTPISLMFASVLGKASSWLVTALGAPYMGEMFIGMGAIALTEKLTGISFQPRGSQTALSVVDNFIATYFTTIFTGLAHTIILAVMCLIGYGVVRLRGDKKVVATNVRAAK